MQVSIVYGKSGANRFTSAFSDIKHGLERWPLWTYLAWDDIKQTYHRSLLGMLWVSLSFALFVGVKMLVFIPLMQGGATSTLYYSAYLMLGYFGWVFISSVLNTAPTVFTSNEGFIKNDPLPLSLYVFRYIARHVVTMALMALVVALGLVFFVPERLSPVNLMAIPALLLYVLNSIWAMLLLGVVCTRWRDVGYLMQTIMRLMFFLVPIFWIPDQMGVVWEILKWNPLAHFLIILRDPLLGEMPDMFSWTMVLATTVIGWAAAIPVFAIFRRRVVFWF